MERGQINAVAEAPADITDAILHTRQNLHAHFGLPLAALGCVVLVISLLQQLRFEPVPAFGILAAAVVLAVAAIAFHSWRTRKLGMWARPVGDPSLEAPTNRGADPAVAVRIQYGALLVLAALVAGAYFYGVRVDTVTFWGIGYGICHMALYCMSLVVNLRMREQILPLAWFVIGGLYWLKAGHSIGLVFGGGWLLTGLLLYVRQHQFEKLARSEENTR